MPRRLLLIFAASLVALSALAAPLAASAHRGAGTRTFQHGALCPPAVARTRALLSSCATTVGTNRRAAHTKLRAKAASVARHGTKFTRPSVSGGLVVGLDADTAGWGNDSTGPRIDLVTSQTGAKWFREVFKWSTIEPAPGQFDFSYYDHYMLLAAQRGVHVLGLLNEAPTWAGSTPQTIPSDPTAFAQYVAAVVGRYGANGSFWAQHPELSGAAVHTWELWNEPYLPSGNNNDYNPGRYARLVKAAAIAGRSADPNAKFLLASEMQSDRDSSGNWQWWTDALYQAVPDLNNYFNGVAVHDYGNDTSNLNPMITGQAYDNYGHIRRIEDLHNQFLAHGATDKPFWITEAGWSTCTDTPTCVTPTQQASNLTALFSLIHTRWSSWVQGAFIYRYGDGANPGSSEDAYGLTNLDGSAKPALAVFKAQALQSAS
jgi:hypothetical protein